MKGITGKIVKVNLTNKSTSIINTEDYAEYAGGHGMGTAIFWDMMADKLPMDPFDPDAVLTIISNPGAGTLAPSTCRTEIMGIGPQSYPITWFTRSNGGGRFAAMLKYAGYDGIVLQGASPDPVWLNIVDGDVTFEDASPLWGLDTWETQQDIWRYLNAKGYGKWSTTGNGETTQRPSILAIGQAGENLCSYGCIMTGAGSGFGQGGFGAVWGSKNLKAISAWGTGSLEIADPKALLESRIWAKEEYGFNVNAPTSGWTRFGSPTGTTTFGNNPGRGGPQSCTSCTGSCRGRYERNFGNESTCVESIFYAGFDRTKHAGDTATNNRAADMLNRYGINAYQAWRGLEYLRDLNAMGVLGKGKQIECDLPFDQLGEDSFMQEYLYQLATRTGIGEKVANGFVRAAESWGRMEEDFASEILLFPYWGYPEHGYDPRAEVEWGYGSILTTRDINEHDYNALYWSPSGSLWGGADPWITAEEAATLFTDNMVPYEGDPLMLDYGTENIYSDHWAKSVAWQRHYCAFWKQSAGYCDWRHPDLYNAYQADKHGGCSKIEQRFYNDVTGANISFVDGMEEGRKIFNMENAIWALQGRTRDMVKFASYIYDRPYGGGAWGTGMMPPGYWLPGRVGGEWQYINAQGRQLDRASFEDWKTKFYEFEGWDTATGWPTRATLEGVGLSNVADLLESKGKLGS